VTLEQLENEVLLREAEGRDRMILSMTRVLKLGRRMPRRRVRVLPGVLGDMVGYAGGTITVDVEVRDLRRYLDRVRRAA
jgi:hypothetical protein